ncbi:putative o-succinylbenzoate-CoA ligase domain protein [Mycobacterium xenopi 3993]|nr:putative o-succinylbenzoate-CoA ligase domain protein [Mycobacterium xenopi 3993]
MGLTVRDGYGQTETTLLIGNLPGRPVKPGPWADRCPVCPWSWSTRPPATCRRGRNLS